MQLSNYIALTLVVLLSIFNVATCQSGQMASKPVYLTFREIKNTIVELDNSQQSDANQNKPPNFDKSAKMLVKLAMEADEATDLLKQMGDEKLLDNESIWHIQRSVKTSARHVHSITKMTEMGKKWFDKYNVTPQVVHILQTNAYQFQLLFRELEFHLPPADYYKFGHSITLFMCSIINAIHYLDPHVCHPQGLKVCQQFEKDQNHCFNTHTIVHASVKPKGMDSCGNSSKKYLQCAYQTKTLGTNNVTCSSTMKPAHPHYVPENAFLM